jgi:hypothetical protein
MRGGDSLWVRTEWRMVQSATNRSHWGFSLLNREETGKVFDLEHSARRIGAKKPSSSYLLMTNSLEQKTGNLRSRNREKNWVIREESRESRTRDLPRRVTLDVPDIEAIINPRFAFV